MPPHYTRPRGIQKKTRKEKEKERKEKEDKKREVIRAEVFKEIEDRKKKEAIDTIMEALEEARGGEREAQREKRPLIPSVLWRTPPYL